METIFEFINILGSFSLAVSGALTAMHKRFDVFGVFIVGFVTAVGGGTMRDMFLTEREVFWLHDTSPLYAILIGTVLAILFRSKIKHLNKPLLLFDAIGLGLFTITGVQIGINQNLELINCVILGTITGTFGGIIRYILVNEIPVIFRKEVYATISILGGFVYYFLANSNLESLWTNLIPIVLIIALRLIVVYYKISLPSIYSKEKIKN
jgi:uncharacterized membrane protein YeiH